MRGICEGVEHHLWSSDYRPAYRGIRTLQSSTAIPRCTAVRAGGGGLLTVKSEVKARWAGYFERLYPADQPAVEFAVRGDTLPAADPPLAGDHFHQPREVQHGCHRSQELHPISTGSLQPGFAQMKVDHS